MQTRLQILLLSALTIVCNGCLARQVARDGQNVRQALLEMYTDQAMDNLIRARAGEPFVQLSYNNLSVQDTDSANVIATGGDAAFGNSKMTDLTKAAPLNVLRGASFAGKFPFGVSGERDRVLTFHAEPVTTENWIYEEYLAFAKDPSLFVVSAEKPDHPVHISRKWRTSWYWVPAEAKKAFLELVLNTSTSPDSTEPIGYWETTIKSSVESPIRDNNGKVRYYKYAFVLQDKLPEDRGAVQVLQSNRCKYWLAVILDPNTDPKEEQSDRIIAQSSNSLGKLDGATVRFFAETHPNLKPRPSAQQKVQDTLESIRILLSKNGSNGS